VSYDSLTNQTITVKPQASYSKRGQPTSGTPVDYQARVEHKDMEVLDVNGATKLSTMRIFFPAAAAVAADDSVTFNGKDWRVLKVEDVVRGSGEIHHKEAMV
jgi:hypothetical protein